MKTLTLAEVEQALIARKRELGLTGRDLLQAIADNAHAQGRTPRFPANFIRT